MTWYYAEAGRQVGPVTNEQFQTLVQLGTVRGDTLVWREGLASWLPYSSVGPAPGVAAPADSASSPAGPAGVVCAECRQIFPADQVARFGDAFVCANCKPAYVQKLREGVLVAAPDALRYAGFWIRVGAKFIDWFIVFIVTFPVSFIFGFRMTLNPPAAPPAFADILVQQGLLTVFSVGISLLYTWLFVGRYGATPGKMILRLKVVMANGQPVTYGRAFARYWGELVSQLTCYIGYIIAAFDDEKRTLHDHMCNTRIVFK